MPIKAGQGSQNETYSLDHIGLRKWIELEDIRYCIHKAAESEDAGELALQLCLYISAVFDIQDIKQLEWYEIAVLYEKIVLACIPNKNLAIFSVQIKQELEVSWDYEGRTFYLWSNILAHAYGWTLNYIAEIYFNDALALMQEIMVTEQLEKEWQWMTTELAYEPIKGTDRVRLRPLPRPDWMKEKKVFDSIKKIKIPKDMIPVGAIVRMDGTHETVIH